MNRRADLINCTAIKLAEIYSSYFHVFFLLFELYFWWCPKKYADIKRQANNDISIVQNFLLKQRNLANLNY